MYSAAQLNAFAQQPQQVFVSQARPQPQAAPLPQQAQQQQPMPAPGAMPGQPGPAQFEKTVSQVLTFFFGHKKDKTEEKERRNRDDFAKTGLFGEERKVEESAKSDLGGGQS